MKRSYRFPHPGASSLLTSRGYDNPLFALNNNPNTELTDRTTASVNVDYQAALWLKVAYSLGGDYYGDTQMTGYALTGAFNAPPLNGYSSITISSPPRRTSSPTILRARSRSVRT